jgi:hypothetical protein
MATPLSPWLRSSAGAEAANATPDWHWDMTPVCKNANVLGAIYNEPNNRVAGHELVTCPNGCAAAVDGGPVAHCR